jgi:hypothetical protein
VDDTRCEGVRLAFETNAATTFVEQTSDIFQSEFDAEALKAVEPSERLFVR